MLIYKINLAEIEGGDKPRNEKEGIKFVMQNIGELIRIALLNENLGKEEK
ncbi:MAG: hypothetical protein Unbinned400contig1004_29 [Prokaryotic dsDNA virus sp.]|nr:MAG: hypothetical protein Unbinned400contig1004_29 [Prokaryotic dsDNA virus sp.]|tara:strand:+ start:629 stop:778 length:150 start_codon:yes stop_codon:yes gene_type:complete